MAGPVNITAALRDMHERTLKSQSGFIVVNKKKKVIFSGSKHDAIEYQMSGKNTDRQAKVYDSPKYKVGDTYKEEVED